MFHVAHIIAYWMSELAALCIGKAEMSFWSALLQSFLPLAAHKNELIMLFTEKTYQIRKIMEHDIIIFIVRLDISAIWMGFNTLFLLLKKKTN